VSRDSKEAEAVRQLLLGHHWMKVQMNQSVLEMEFPSEDWIAFAALLLLPPAGYRVHVIRESQTQ
jgi:hypothetical protein